MRPHLMSPDKKCCWTCRHWWAAHYQISFSCAKSRMDTTLREIIDDGVTTEHGTCHRFPPGGGQRPFPYTFGQCHCGEWASKPCQDDRPIADLDFSVRARNVFERAEIETLTDLCARTPQELRAMRNFGPTCLAETRALLAAERLHLRGDKSAIVAREEVGRG